MSHLRKIDPAHVQLDFGGHCTSQWFVRLPEWAVADDMKDPSLWSRVQATRSPLRVHDELYIVGFAAAFAVEARVIQATNAAAVLALQKIISFPERLTPLFADESYRVVWTVEGFGVERKSDSARIGGTFGSEQLAIRHISAQYPVSA